MNKVILIGRLTKDPDITYTTGENQMAIARYTLAVDRKFKKGEADFIQCTAFAKNGEFAEKYLHKGMKICVEGRIQTGSYEKDGKKVFTTTVAVDSHEFVESKSQATDTNVENETNIQTSISDDEFMKIPEGTDETGLPFF